MADSSLRQRSAAPGERRMFRDPAGREPAVPPEAAEPTPRAQVTTAAGLSLLAGIWLIIAPFVLGYGDGDPYWNDIVFGALVAVISLGQMLAGARYAWLSWLNMLIGAWVFASAFWLDASGRASWNDAILGVIVFLLGAAGAARSTVGGR
jgi:SPW repeat